MFLLMSLGSKVRAHRDYLNARFGRDEEGVTAMEYGLIAALIAIVIIVALTLAGGALSDIFTRIACELQGENVSYTNTGEAGDGTCETS